MNAYTRRPSRLNTQVYTAFHENTDLNQPCAYKQSKEEVCFELGNSLIPNDMEAVSAGVGENSSKRKVKIPAMFQSGVTAKKELVKENSAYGRSDGELSSKQEVSSEKIKQECDAEDDVLSSINRPSSQLIKDGNNLPQLFDSLHGKKESQQAVARNIGKLRMPGIFQSTDDEPGKVAGKKVEEKTSGGVKVESGRSFKNAMQMSFSDWQNGEGQEKNVGGSTRSFKGRSLDFVGGEEKDLHEDGEEIVRAREDFDAADKMTKGGMNINNDNFDKQKISASSRHDDSEIQPTLIMGENQNKRRVHKTDEHNMNSITSDSQSFSMNDSKVEVVNEKTFRKPAHVKANSLKELKADKPGAVSGMKAEAAIFSGEKATMSLTENSSAPARIGKLKMPDTFLNAGDSKGDKDVSARQTRKQVSKIAARELQGKFDAGNVDGKGVDVARENSQRRQENQESTTLEKSQRGSETEGRKERAVNWRNDGSGNHSDRVTFNSHTGVRKSHEKQAPLQDTTDFGENQSQPDRKPQIGRLDLQSIFTNFNDKENDNKVKEKEENSVFQKNKAMFDQKMKKSQGKQGRVGKLRLNSAKTDQDEELENLNIQGEVPSNMSTQMKVQLEKILQQRSASISSQGSLVSPKNDGKEGSFSRSVSSVSSTGSPRLSNSFSSDSNLLRYTEAQENEESSDVEGQKRVNSGSLQSQLDGIFQARVSGRSGSSSVETSPGSSLDASLNASSVDESESSAMKPSFVDESREKRKLITDAIKLRYSPEEDDGGDGDGKEESGKDDGGKEEGENVGDGLEEFRKRSTIDKNDVDNGARVEGSGLQTGMQEAGMVRKLVEKDSSSSSGVGQPARQQVERKKRGKVSIPGVFSGAGISSGVPSAERELRKSRNVSVGMDGGASGVERKSDHQAGQGDREIQDNDEKPADESRKVTEGERTVKKLSIPSNFQKTKTPSDTQRSYNRPKVASFKAKSAEGKDNVESADVMRNTTELAASGKFEGSFKGDEMIGNSDEGGAKADGGKEEARRKPAGKLSASMLTAFQNNSGQNEVKKLAYGSQITRKSKKEPQGKQPTEGTGVVVESNSDAGQQQEEIQGLLNDSQAAPQQLEDNNNDVILQKSSTVEAKSSWQKRETPSTDQQQNSNVQKATRRTVGKLNIPLAFQ